MMLVLCHGLRLVDRAPSSSLSRSLDAVSFNKVLDLAAA
jgi:hypothetical protein